jgi:hypothetical protein
MLSSGAFELSRRRLHRRIPLPFERCPVNDVESSPMDAPRQYAIILGEIGYRDNRRLIGRRSFAPMQSHRWWMIRPFNISGSMWMFIKSLEGCQEE